jgi:stearoyl-CoA desaturase (delta-9 desaturase)
VRTFAASKTMSSTTTTVPTNERVDFVAAIPFFLVHLMCLFVFYTGVTWVDLLVCVGLYYVRMVGITAGYHRYFAHRAYKTSRVGQFLIALLGSTAAQKGVLWWAAHHRHHHRYSDLEEDIHSPLQKGFWFSHVGWILCRRYDETRFDQIKDFARFPELRFLNRWHLIPPIVLGTSLFFIGGFRMLVVGFFISTVLLWHGTFTINSLSHVFGSRRYKTTDTSKNNWLLALMTCGEGWHNNHHYHQNTANQGWFWWEVDFSYYVLKAMSFFRLVWDLRLPSDAVKLAHLKYSEEDRAALRAPMRFRWSRTGAASAREKVRAAWEAARDALPSSSAGPAPQPLLKR